jgi:MOSC domain-containing protein YiiM
MKLSELIENYHQAGEVVWIGVRPERRSPVQILASVNLIAGKGLEGDRYKSPDGSRQVTLIQEEHLHAVGAFMNKPPVDPSLTRRNIVVKGINLLALNGKQFRIGNALLEYSGECHPCSRMEENLGKGGYNAMRGHGGITARILVSGEIRLGDRVMPTE